MQQELRLLGRLDAPATAPHHLVDLCRSYRDAVRMCWEYRRVKSMTRRGLCEQAGLCPQHVSDYFNADDKATRRDLPAKSIAEFEAACGNTIVSQWLCERSHLTCLEQMQADNNQLRHAA